VLHYAWSSSNRGGRGGRNGGRGGRSRGGRSNVQCQVCHKWNHDASICFHRFKRDYVPTIPLEDPQVSNPNPPWPQPHYRPTSRPPQSNYPYPPPWNPYTWPKPQVPYPMAANLYTNPYAPMMSPQLQPQAFVASSSSTPSFNWYSDSGASHHVTSSSQNIHQLSPFEGPDQVYLGNGQGLSISHFGSSSFSSPLKPNVQLILHNLLLVPTITKNLLSVSQFAKDNSVYFEFHSDICLVKSQGTNEVLLQGTVGPDGLYQFPNMLSPSVNKQSMSAFPSFNSCNLSIPSMNVAIATSQFVSVPSCNTVDAVSCNFASWHARLGHPSAEIQRIVLSNCNIPFTNKSISDFCSSCCMGKAHKLPSHSSTTVYTAPLELTVTDLWGLAPMQSSNGFYYYMTFVDAFTRFT
ncbi:retrovirus-related Pol polyprotein from transposon TNT 1-94, partial [Trifolium medium]|nr:retrovirus-related Pol polyprotein from transposon TNT 1-94 [Trifolium medium]